MTIVDIIVPVCRGAGAARRCIESVLSSPQAHASELIVVDDDANDAELSSWIRDLAARGRVTVLEQRPRQGFAAAINRAIALHRERDVVVLQSDALVANDWLDRLATHAEKAPDIGTVAPFASGGGVAGYPRSGVDNALPAGHDLVSIDALFRRANAGAAVDVILSCGPCVYFRRACLDAVGAFDFAPLGSDNGIEQDFCLRASAGGFRHVLATDVYVWHPGATDLGAYEALTSHAVKAMSKLYPQYPAQRAEFDRRDPARPFQRSVDLLRLSELPRPLVLFVSHGWGGGIRRHIDDLAAIAGDRIEVLMLQPAAGHTVKLSWPREGEGFAAYFSLPRELPALIELLRALGIARMHFHHVHGLPQAILDIPMGVGVPYDCTLHDYYSICPQYHLVTEEGRYCGEPDAAGCAACLARRPGQWGLDIAAWRGVFGHLLRGAARVFAPTRDVAQRIARYFPDVEAIVIAHPEAPTAAPQRMTRVITVGNLSPEKGLRVVAACALDARARDLPLAFRVLGPTTGTVPQWPEAALSIHGQYADDELPALIAAERPDVIWFPAQIPETYSYALSVAIAAGTAIVASSLGAFPERLAGHPQALLVPWNATPSEWNAALLDAGSAQGARSIRARATAS